MFRIFKFLFFLSIFLLSVIGSAHKPQLQFNHITSKDGLSHSWVTHIYKDSYGYMWFATEGNGINKYDGHSFTVYKHNPKDRKSLTDNLVTFIYEDKKRNLWIGTQYGLNIYDRELNKFKPYVNLYDRYVGGMCEINDGKFYISDNGPGIEEKYFNQIFKIFHTLDKKPANKSTGIGLTIVKKIIDLYEGEIWVESKTDGGTTFYFTLPKQNKRILVK